jgi:Cof subfamily protein (haloacid dehalogenase superfamily)
LLPGLLEAAQRFGWNIHFETSDRLYFPKQSNHPPVFFELLRYSNWVRVGDLLHDMPEPPHKLIVTLNKLEDRKRTVSEMVQALGKAVSIVPSHPHLIEALPAGVDKGQGLRWLAAHLGVAQSEVLAIGDSEADVPMLEWAGIGVAMGNASPEAKAAADWIAPTVESDGAAAALQRFILDSA